MDELWLIKFGQIRFSWYYLLTRPCIAKAPHSFISIWHLMICPLLVPYDNFFCVLGFHFLRRWLRSWNLILLCYFAFINFLSETRSDMIWIWSMNIFTLINKSNLQLELFSLSLQFFDLFVLLLCICFKLHVFRFQFRIILHHLFRFWIRKSCIFLQSLDEVRFQWHSTEVMAFSLVVKNSSRRENKTMTKVFIFKEVGLLTESSCLISKYQRFYIILLWVDEDHCFLSSNYDERLVLETRY